MADTISINLNVKAVEDQASFKRISDEFGKALRDGTKLEDVFRPLEAGARSLTKALHGDFSQIGEQLYKNIELGAAKMQDVLSRVDMDFVDTSIEDFAEKVGQIQEKAKEISELFGQGIFPEEALETFADLSDEFDELGAAARSALPEDVWEDILQLDNAKETVYTAAGILQEGLEQAANEGLARAKESFGKAGDIAEPVVGSLKEAFDKLPETAKPAIYQLMGEFEKASQNLMSPDISDLPQSIYEAFQAEQQLVAELEKASGIQVDLFDENALAEVRDTMPQLTESVERYNNALEAMYSSANLADSTAGVQESISGVGEAAAEAAQSVENVGESAAQASANLENSGVGVDELANAFQRLYRAQDKARANQDVSSTLKGWQAQRETVNSVANATEKAAKSAEKLSKVDTSKVKKGLSDIKKEVNPLEAGFKKLAKAALAFFSIRSIINIGKQMLELSSEAVDLQVTVNSVFGDMKGVVDEFADSAIDTFGLTSVEVKKYATEIGGMVKNFGVATDAAAEMGVGMAKLTADFENFYGVNRDEAFKKIQSALSGNARALKQYGVDVSDASLETYRLAQGIEVAYKDMDAASKATLRYNYILETMSNIQGAAAQRSGSWSSQVNQLKANLRELGSVLGGILQNVLLPVLTVVNQILSSAISGAKALAKMFGFDIETLIKNQGMEGAGAGVGMAEGMDELTDSTDDATDAQKKLNAEQKKSLANIHKLNTISSQSSSGADDDKAKKPAGGIDAGLGLVDYAEIEVVSKKTDSWLDSLLEGLKPIADRAKELFDLFKSGFEVGLGGKDLSKVLENLKSIGERVKGIIEDLKNNEELKLHVDNIVFNMGKILGDITSIGINIAEILTGAIDRFLEQHKMKIELDIVNVFAQLDDLFNSLARITGAIDDIFTLLNNDDTIQAVADTLAGIWDTTFALVDIFLTLTNTVAEVIAKFLELNTEVIAFDIQHLIEQFATFSLGVADIAMALDTIIQAFRSTDAIDTFTNALTAVYNIISSIVYVLSSLLADITAGIGLIAQVNAEGIKTALEGIFSALSKVTEAIKDLSSNIRTNVIEMYDNHIKPLIEDLSSGIADIISTIVDGWNTHIQPVLDWAADTLDSLIREHISPMFDKIFGFVNSTIDMLRSLWNNVLQPLVNWIASAIIPVVANVIDRVVTVFNYFAETVSDVVGDIMDFLSGLMTWLDGVFSGDADKIIDGLVQMVKGAVNLVIDLVEAFVNKFIDAVNWVIRALNRLHIDVPDWLGGGTWGFNIAELSRFSIPHLAEGAVIPPNNEFLAVLGDQRRGTNIETPLSTMIQAFSDALYANRDLFNNAGTASIVIYVNDELKTDELIKMQGMHTWRVGGM